MKHWFHALHMPPATNENVIVCYYPTIAGKPRRAIGYRNAHGEWRLQSDGDHGPRRAVVAWTEMPEIPDTLEALA